VVPEKRIFNGQHETLRRPISNLAHGLKGSFAMKLPALQFYVGDWRKDPGVQSLTLEQRGAWLEMLFIMHEADPRGHLVLNGKPFPPSALARLLGIGEDLLNQTSTLLVERGIASVEPSTGVIFSRRMVRDEELRKTRAECGKMGGNPVLLKHKVNHGSNHGSNQKPTPSVSSSVSSSEEDMGLVFPENLKTDGFSAAWKEWLAFRRQQKFRNLKTASMQAQIKVLSEWGESAAVESIKQSIRQGWQGLFEPKANGSSLDHKSHADNKTHSSRSFIQRNDYSVIGQ
jgi:hypothetical protein